MLAESKARRPAPTESAGFERGDVFGRRSYHRAIDRSPIGSRLERFSCGRGVMTCAGGESQSPALPCGAPKRYGQMKNALNFLRGQASVDLRSTLEQACRGGACLPFEHGPLLPHRQSSLSNFLNLAVDSTRHPQPQLLNLTNAKPATYNRPSTHSPTSVHPLHSSPHGETWEVNHGLICS